MYCPLLVSLIHHAYGLTFLPRDSPGFEQFDARANEDLLAQGVGEAVLDVSQVSEVALKGLRA